MKLIDLIVKTLVCNTLLWFSSVIVLKFFTTNTHTGCCWDPIDRCDIDPSLRQDASCSFSNYGNNCWRPTSSSGAPWCTSSLSFFFLLRARTPECEHQNNNNTGFEKGPDEPWCYHSFVTTTQAPATTTTASPTTTQAPATTTTAAATTQAPTATTTVTSTTQAPTATTTAGQTTIEVRKVLELKVAVNDCDDKNEMNAFVIVLRATLASITGYDESYIKSQSIECISHGRRRILSQDATLEWDFKILMPDSNGISSDSISNNVDTLTTTNRDLFASTFVTLASQNNNLPTQDESTVRESLQVSNPEESSDSDNATTIIVVVVVIVAVLAVLITAYVYGSSGRSNQSEVMDLKEIKSEIGLVERESERGMYESPLMGGGNDEDAEIVSSGNGSEKKRNSDRSETGIVAEI